MNQTDISQTPTDGVQPAWTRFIKAIAVVQMCLFAAVWMGFCIFAFCMVHGWGVEYDRKMEMIRRGEVKPDTLYVVEISQNKNGGNQNVSLSLEKGGKAVAWRSDDKFNDVRVGDTVEAYRFDDVYLIPQFDRGGFHWGEWIFLAFGMLPLPVAAGALLVGKL